MDYVLTEHARDVLEKRHIQIAWMERALTCPEVTETEIGGEPFHEVKSRPTSRRALPDVE